MLDTFKTFIYGRLSINWKNKTGLQTFNSNEMRILFSSVLEIEILGIETKTNWLSMGNNKMSG